ncbi:hypothetical protein AB0M43_14845 [Longispora sp. NPDC051575]|uniref:hypothetical protein n=1 Tax=Longispora sp. NPDC051575 TaxID=3154943 RepID=UPI00341D8D43
MTIENIPVGGFAGDPAEALNPPAASGGCCGTATAATGTASPAADAGAPAGTCCGTATAAQEAGTCCAPEAKAEAVAAGAGCCG